MNKNNIFNFPRVADLYNRQNRVEDPFGDSCFCCHVDIAYQTMNIIITKGPFKCYVTLFFWKVDPHPPPRSANNIEHHTFVTLFSRKSDTPPPYLRYVTLERPLKQCYFYNIYCSWFQESQ